MADERAALACLGSCQVKLRTLLATYSGAKLPAEFVNGILDCIQRMETVLADAGKEVERKA